MHFTESCLVAVSADHVERDPVNLERRQRGVGVAARQLHRRQAVTVGVGLAEHRFDCYGIRPAFERLLGLPSLPTTTSPLLSLGVATNHDRREHNLRLAALADLPTKLDPAVIGRDRLMRALHHQPDLVEE
jgi:hypothetical protein